ncbi:MAG: DUF58 domain-containing protein [Planctomycetaceae bacterium]|nr:DUF58 domain-containing protein [Planctomycetaceae bacterium]
MDENRKYLDPAVLVDIKGLDLKARLIVEGYVSGLHKSPYRGFSSEFVQHREYVAGDDLRYVDWRVYGKSDRFFLKQFEEETNFTCHILLDCSESMSYCSSGAAVSKLEYAKYVAAALAWLTIQQHDAVGLATFDDALKGLLRASNQPSHLKQLVHQLELARPAGKTALAPIFHDLADRIKKRGLVIILSDLFDDVDSVLRSLKHFHHRRHDVSVIQIIDPAEQDFPFEDITLFQGLEGASDQMADAHALRGAYREEFERFLLQVRRGLRDLDMHHELVRTDQKLDGVLSALLTNRSRRMGRV